MLIIITGKSLPRVYSDDRNVDELREAYKLSDEIQRVLIEDFLPPISSSTVPGNPGRLYIELSSIEENKI